MEDQMEERLGSIAPRYAKLQKIDSSLPSRCFIKLISNPKLSRADASKIFQIRMGHIPLNTMKDRRRRETQPNLKVQRRTSALHLMQETPSKQRTARLEHNHPWSLHLGARKCHAAPDTCTIVMLHLSTGRCQL